MPKKDNFKGPNLIFIIGSHRSGTTWLTNILESHPLIFTPTHKIHNGQHESVFFSKLLPYCNRGESRVDLIAIDSLFKSSDFFQLLPLSKQELPNIEENGFINYFKSISIKSALKKKSQYFVEKSPSHTLVTKQLLNWYPEAKFIAITRNRYDTVRSIVYKVNKSHSPLAWFKSAIATSCYNRIIKHYRDEVKILKYEHLIKNYKICIDELSNYLALDRNDFVGSRFKAASSFKGTKPRISFAQKVIINTAFIMLCLVPFRILEWSIHKFLNLKKTRLPEWYFDLK